MATRLPDPARRLLEAAPLAHLVTLNADGSPQVTVVWVGLDGDEIVSGHLGVWQKIRNVRRDPRVALSVETSRRNEIGLAEYLVVHGRARVTEGGGADLLQRLAGRYIGPGVRFPPMDEPPPGYVLPPEAGGGGGGGAVGGGDGSRRGGMSSVLVDLDRVAARRPDRALFEDLSLTLRAGDRLGVVGRNGSGKSTLLRVVAGADQPEGGTVRRGRGVCGAFLPQSPVLPPGTVRAAVGEHWEAAAVLERLGMASVSGDDVATLSGGQAKRVALARALVTDVDLLVLDEPTNHLDVEAVTWLEDRLARYRGGLVLVTHDRHVLDRVTTRILELDRGRGHVHDGGYEAYLAAAAERAEREEQTETVRRNLARAELAWLRRGAPARTRKPKARVAAATAVVEHRPPPPDRAGRLELATASDGVPRLGDKVVVLRGVGHRFGDGPWLFRDLDVDLEPGGRLGVVGPNGSGKSTLLDVIAGRLAPAAGAVDTGPTVHLSYYDQVGGRLDPAMRVREAVAGPDGRPTWEQVRLMERFWFDADAQWAPVGTLSGGERRRLQLLLALAARPNVLLLDEPTNDLDLDTLRALEDHLDDWPGTVVVVSHDRALLERTADELLVLDGHGGARRAPASGPELLRRAPRGPAPRPAPARSGGNPAAAAPLRASKPRSPSTLRRLVALAEQDMEAAAAERDRRAGELAAARDHVERAAAARALAETEERVAAAEERWLGLAEELGA